ncbi:MAG TPA: hypothetical protein VFR41_14340 [Acidimicrobiia bacterium]|nr:hypothetical protein [Acidimicrobiia bacterium]
MRRAVAVLALVVGAAACSSSSHKSAPATTIPTTTTLPPRLTAKVVGETVVSPAFRQGLARDGDGWVFSLNTALFRTDNAFNITKRLDVAIPARDSKQGFNHIGDIDVEGGILYAPLEQPNYALDRQAMLTYDPTTLKFLGGVYVKQHHNSFITVDPATHIAYSQLDYGGKSLLRYDIAHGWKPLPPLPMSRYVDKVQGADLRDGALWLSTDDKTDGVWWVDPQSGRVQYLGSVGRVAGEGEGIDATVTPSGDLHVLDVDPAFNPVRVIDMRVTAAG